MKIIECKERKLKLAFAVLHGFHFKTLILMTWGSCRCWKLSDIHLSLSVVCRYFIWALSLLFGPCHLLDFTLAGPHCWLLDNTEIHENVV